MDERECTFALLTLESETAANASASRSRQENRVRSVTRSRVGTADAMLQFTAHERDSGVTADTSGDVLDYMHARYYWGGGRPRRVGPVWESQKAQKNRVQPPIHSEPPCS